MNRDQQLWGVALWVEREHGDDGPAYIADQVTCLALIGDVSGVAMWRKVAERYDQLQRGAAAPSCPHLSFRKSANCPVQRSQQRLRSFSLLLPFVPFSF